MESTDFAARILRVESVSDIPKADRISVVRVLGFESVARRNADGSHAFAPGERIIYVPEDAIIPVELLQRHGLWGPHRDTGIVQGLLAGPGGNRVRIEIFRKQLSTGLVWKMMPELEHLPDNADVTDLLGITKHVDELSEDVLRFATPMPAVQMQYNIARYKNHPTLLEGDEVVLTEKLEGECLQMTWMGGIRHDGMFHDGRIAVASKGLALQGLCFRDLPEVRKEGVVRAAFNSDLFGKLEGLAAILGPDRTVLLVSEAIGPGIKKLHYGGKEPFARGLDIAVDGVWLTEDEIDHLLKSVDLPRAPVLWRGIFDADVIESYREGKTTFEDKHIREGVVVKSTGSQALRETAVGTEVRPVLKVHSDVFQRKLGHDKADLPERFRDHVKATIVALVPGVEASDTCIDLDCGGTKYRVQLPVYDLDDDASTLKYQTEVLVVGDEVWVKPHPSKMKAEGIERLEGLATSRVLVTVPAMRFIAGMDKPARQLHRIASLISYVRPDLGKIDEGALMVRQIRNRLVMEMLLAQGAYLIGDSVYLNSRTIVIPDTVANMLAGAKLDDVFLHDLTSGAGIVIRSSRREGDDIVLDLDVPALTYAEARAVML